MNKTRLRVGAIMRAELIHPDGTKEYRENHNLVLNSGISYMCDSIGNISNRPNIMTHIAIGSSGTAVASTQISLSREVKRAPAAFTHSDGSLACQFEATFEPGAATGEVREAGICNAASSGIFLDRVTFPVINKGNYDTLKVMFEFSITPDTN